MTTPTAVGATDDGRDRLHALAHMSAKACDAKHGSHIARLFETTDGQPQE